MAGEEDAWANTLAKKANCIAQVDGESLAARKGYKNIITLTSIPQAVWANRDPGQAASCGNGLVMKSFACACVRVRTCVHTNVTTGLEIFHSCSLLI